MLRRVLTSASRLLFRGMSSNLSPGEQKLYDTIVQQIENTTKVKVADISGGCGAMYEVHIESPVFAGKSKLQQHQLVNKALKEEIKGMHGIRISTGVTSSAD